MHITQCTKIGKLLTLVSINYFFVFCFFAGFVISSSLPCVSSSSLFRFVDVDDGVVDEDEFVVLALAVGAASVLVNFLTQGDSMASPTVILFFGSTVNSLLIRSLDACDMVDQYSSSKSKSASLI